ncbi:unnamed protein product [Mytilus coruscus]|uniref:Uncharacterized protein n=1 Tax=Mytilus coruscus TaxID=42192 RepID=A0A6J8CBP3_MYTCO|nr:unnamed protein product [Mytilus coruscus]
MHDTGISGLKDYANTVMSLPLTSEGILGFQFDEKLREKTKRNKQLTECLPNLKKIGIPKKPAADFKSGATAKQNSTNKPRVPIHKFYRKYLRFCIQGKIYQFVTLCFGPSQALRMFTKIVTVIAENSECKASDISRRLVTCQCAEVGVHCQSRTIILDPSSVDNIHRSTFQFQKGNCVTNFRDTDQMRNINTQFNDRAQYNKGLFSSVGFDSILHRNDPKCTMRPIHLHLLHYWKLSSRDLFCEISFTLHLKRHLIWWLDRANTARGRTVHKLSANITITTDASKTGFNITLKVI